MADPDVQEGGLVEALGDLLALFHRKIVATEHFFQSTGQLGDVVARVRD